LEAFTTLKASATLQIMPNAKVTTITLEINTRLGVVTNINI